VDALSSAMRMAVSKLRTQRPTSNAGAGNVEHGTKGMGRGGEAGGRRGGGGEGQGEGEGEEAFNGQ
jgi:hypothetical protein